MIINIIFTQIYLFYLIILKILKHLGAIESKYITYTWLFGESIYCISPGKHYGKIVDVKFPLNKKRKLFTNSDTINKLLDHIRDETMPILKKYIEERQRNILIQMST